MMQAEKVRRKKDEKETAANYLNNHFAAGQLWPASRTTNADGCPTNPNSHPANADG